MDDGDPAYFIADAILAGLGVVVVLAVIALVWWLV